MGVVPGPYDVHGWHAFRSGWQGESWCAECDCLGSRHVSEQEYESRKAEFEADAKRFNRMCEEEEI